MTEIDRPIFIVGVDHSGTTILYNMMARHPELAWFSQYSLRGGDLPGRMRVPFHGLVNRVGRAAFDFTWRKKNRLLLPEPREGAGIWRRLVPRIEGFLDESDYTDEIADRVRRAFRSELDAWGLERMLVKIPYLTRAMALLDRIFPDALYIHIVRDGRAVSLSNRDRYMERGHGPFEALRVSARRWVETLDYIEGMEEDLGPRLMTLHYEHFCDDVHGWLQRCIRFSGLSPEHMDLDPIPRALHPTNEKWLSKCPPSEREMLDEVLTPKLRKWGYEPFSVTDGFEEAAPAAANLSGGPRTETTADVVDR